MTKTEMQGRLFEEHIPPTSISAKPLRPDEIKAERSEARDRSSKSWFTSSTLATFGWGEYRLLPMGFLALNAVAFCTILFTVPMKSCSAIRRRCKQVLEGECHALTLEIRVYVLTEKSILTSWARLAVL